MRLNVLLAVPTWERFILKVSGMRRIVTGELELIAIDFDGDN